MNPNTPTTALKNPITCVVDVVLFTLVDGAMHVALFKRENPTQPAHGEWALPGGFIRTDEDSDVQSTAERILHEKAGLKGIYLEQLQCFSGMHRDPERGWTLCVAYCALVPASVLKTSTKADMRLADVKSLRSLPFDHKEIILTALERVRAKAGYSSLPVHLCEAEFTIPELKRAYEALLGEPIDQSNFRRKLKDLDAIEAVTGKTRQTGRSSPAQVYRARRALRGQLVTRDRGLA